ncbi:MAG: RagB/SusD family nutrient uptake outer membrane protein [Bacteroidales bacterium]|nr:RagB/SusD family nutrient uptake outer membrane protein [Bacteroidales bacterium]
MIKINSLTAFILLIISSLIISCEKQLDVEPNDRMTEIDFLNNPENAESLINGIYNKQLDWNMYSFSWIGVTSITSDDADKGSTINDTGTDKKKLDELKWEASDISFQDIWKSRYDGIYRANVAIHYLEQLSLDESTKNRLLGEAKFLRALFYFDLVRCFGGVPIVTSMIDINDNQTINSVIFVRKSQQETYQQIEADLLDAIQKLPLKSEYASTDLGRATKGAAQGLLAKAYLYQQKWSNAAFMAGEVINSNQYQLMADVSHVWREIGENGSESLYEVQATLTKGIQSYTDVQGPRGTPDLGWGFNTPSLSLVNSFDTNDLRLKAAVMFVPSTLWDGYQTSTSWTNPRYNYKAYQSSIAESWNGNKSETAKNLRILKFSDIILIKAESELQLGNQSEALGLINSLRFRAGLPDRNSITLQDIYNERRWEMAMEHDRWFDLVRTGQAKTAMAADGKTFIEGKHELFPIPSEQIIASGGLLTQNFGY